MKASRNLWRGLGVVALLLLGIAGSRAVARWSTTASADDEVPTVRVERGDLIPRIYATGEVRAVHSEMLTAPQIGGGALQITHLVHTGARIKKDEIVIEFDPSEQQFKLEQSRSELEQADQEIIKAKADAAVQGANDKVALLKARFDVRRAELEVGKNELVSAIDAKKNNLALEQAQRVLAQQEQDIKSHSASGQATISVAEEKRHKATLAMEQAQENIEKMKVRAPMDGVVAIEKNTGGDFFFWGMSLPDYHEGDQTRAGATVARIIEPGEMEVSANLSEQDRSNVTVGQSAEIKLDALPGHVFHGVVKTVAGMANKTFWNDDPVGHFEAVIRLPDSDSRVRAGFTVKVVIAGEARKNVLCLPRQAIFTNNAKRIVYVKNGNQFEAQGIQVIAETESRAAVDGLRAGTEVAFVNPTVLQKNSGTSADSALAGGLR